MASNNFINECKLGANSNRLGKYVINEENPNNNVAVNETNYLQSMKITDKICNDGVILGSIFDRTLESTIIGKPTTLDLNGKLISNVAMGVKFENNTSEYVNFDNFIIEGVQDTETGIEASFTAYGSGSKLDEPYHCTIDFSDNPSTIYAVYCDVCTQLGLIPTDNSITNGTIQVIGNPFTNQETCRTVLEEIEKVSCSFVDINWSNQTISLKWFSDTLAYEFNTGDYSILEGGLNKYGPVNVVIIGDPQITGENVTQEDSQSVTQNGEHQIVINAPYFLYTQALRQQAISNIFNKIDGLTYYDLRLIVPYGKPFLKVGDKIKINTVDGGAYYTYILSHELTYDGTFNSIIESPALTQEQIKEKNQLDQISLREKLRKTELVVDKQEGKITAVVGEISDINITLEGYYSLTEDETFHDKTDYYKYENGEYVYFPQYYITTDTTYQSGVQYYTYDDSTNTYTLFTNYNVGDEIEGDKYNKNYNIGDTIPANTYYNLIQKNALERRMSIAEQTLTDQGMVLTVKTSKIDNNGNSTSFISDGADYDLTQDTKFVDGKTYYIVNNGEYVPATVTVGSTIPANTYYEQSTIESIRYELGKNGFITDNGDGFKAIRDAKGDFYYENNTMIGKYTKDGSVQKDMALYGRYYYGIDENSASFDVETFTKDDSMFMAEIYEGDDGEGHAETGFGHFYNGS